MKEKMIQAMYDCEDLLESYERETNEMNGLKFEARLMEKKMKKMPTGGKVGIFFALLTICIVIRSIFDGSFGQPVSPSSMKTNYVILGITVVGTILAALSWKHSSFYKRAEKRYEKAMNDIGEKEGRLAILLLPVVGTCSFLPQQYCTPDAIRAIRSYFETGRADTVKEAIATYHEDMHRAVMEKEARMQTAAIPPSFEVDYYYVKD